MSTALVAGGTGGLGGAVVDSLLAAGWSVAATYAHDNAAAAALRDRPGVRLLPADLTDPDAAAAAVAATPELTAVVDLVGGFAAGPLTHQTDPGELDRMLRLNLLPAFLLARSAMPRLAEVGGAFVAVSARAALRPFPGAAAYVTAKAALLALVQALDVEYGGRGVRCNAVLPGVLDTPANRAAQPEADPSGWTPPARVAEVIRFLVGPEGAAVRGAAIPV